MVRRHVVLPGATVGRFAGAGLMVVVLRAGVFAVVAFFRAGRTGLAVPVLGSMTATVTRRLRELSSRMMVTGGAATRAGTGSGEGSAVVAGRRLVDRGGADRLAALWMGAWAVTAALDRVTWVLAALVAFVSVAAARVAVGDATGRSLRAGGVLANDASPASTKPPLIANPTTDPAPITETARVGRTQSLSREVVTWPLYGVGWR